MSDQDKYVSLRKKGSRRQAIAGPPQEETQDLARARARFEEKVQSNGSIPASRSRSRTKQPGGQTSDMVRKRYSIRYNQIPDIGGNVPPMPGVPRIPRGYGDRQDGSPGPQAQGLDIRALNDPLLDVEQYVTRLLANSSEQEILNYQQKLAKEKNRTSTNLQHNVYQNRTQFIKISKEAERLKGEMQILRGLMSELTGTLGQASNSTGRSSPTLDDGARKRANRSSVANLEAMWSTQLQALWKTVEGSQKYLPAIPGRHIVIEQGNWVELDAATWKTRRPVHIGLLNDHLLIAVRKRKRLDPNIAGNQKAPTKLVADRCWPLQDIDIIDLSTGAKEIRGPFRQGDDITNALTIRHHQESYTYRSDHQNASKEKSELLLAFKRTVDELRRAEKAEVDEMGSKSKETMNYLALRDPSISKSPHLLRTLSKAKDRPEILIDVDGKQRNLRWVEGQIDELDIEVALQRFDEAVNRVEQLRRLAKSLKGNTVAQDLINVKVDERAGKLADLITQRLIDTHSFLTQTQTNVSHLTRLDFSSRARTAYLSARSATITKRARQCVFEGGLPSYIVEISFVYFTLIKNTVSVYQQCFPMPMMSACVVWAKGHLDGFNMVLERGLSSVPVGGDVWQECLGRAREMAGMLDEVGLDFRGLVGVGLEGKAAG